MLFLDDNKTMERFYIKNTAYKEAKNIIYKAKQITEGIVYGIEDYYSTYLNFDNFFYEMLFFIYCIEIVKIIHTEREEKLCDKIKEVMFTELETISDIKFNKDKILVKELFNQRKMNYLAMIKTYELKLNSKFYNEAFDFQAKELSKNQKSPEVVQNIIKSALLENKVFL